MAADDDRKKNGVIIVATFLEGVTHLLINRVTKKMSVSVFERKSVLDVGFYFSACVYLFHIFVVVWSFYFESHMCCFSSLICSNCCFSLSLQKL